MSDIVSPYNNKSIESQRRPFCRMCGKDYTHPKFGGKVITANSSGQYGRSEIIFCQKCSVMEEAQQVYHDLMLVDTTAQWQDSIEKIAWGK